VIDGVVAPVLHAYFGLAAEALAVNVAGLPAQIVAEFTLTVGSGLTVTVPEPVLEQPVVPSVTVTV
jgi:hypothetical protein